MSLNILVPDLQPCINIQFVVVFSCLEEGLDNCMEMGGSSFGGILSTTLPYCTGDQSDFQL